MIPLSDAAIALGNRSMPPVPGLDLYPAGALSVAIGSVLLSLDWWKRANGRAFVPVLFVLSIVTGLVGQMVPRAAVLFVASGVIFGAAMVEVGRQVLLAAAAAPRNKDSRVHRKSAR